MAGVFKTVRQMGLTTCKHLIKPLFWVHSCVSNIVEFPLINELRVRTHDLGT